MPYHNERATGRTRFRLVKPWFKPEQLVLEMEFIYDDGPSDANGMPEYLKGRYWRDAQVTDFQQPGWRFPNTNRYTSVKKTP